MSYQLTFKIYFVTKNEKVPTYDDVEAYLRKNYLPKNSAIQSFEFEKDKTKRPERKDLLSTMSVNVKFKDTKEMLLNRLKVFNMLELLDKYKADIKTDGINDYMIVFIGVI